MRSYSIPLLFLMGLVACVFVPPKNPPLEINGASLVNPPSPIDSAKMAELSSVNANWVAVIPYGFSRSGEPDVSFDHQRQWWGERTNGTCKLIQYAKQNNLKVMVKPHVWVRGEGWTGNYTLKTEEEWISWENAFTLYIVNHAIKADSMNAELFCIGTEYRIPAKERPAFWRGLIAKVRDVYDGKITYASNWDNYENITWWDAVDYIGVDAYFPLVDGKHPSVDEIKNGWQPIKENLKAFSTKWDKPIIFTEYGFQSVNGAAGKHWSVAKTSENTNNQLQADAYEATFQAFENEDWFQGGFFWKWHFMARTQSFRGTEWTPQNKPAMETISKWYGKK